MKKTKLITSALPYVNNVPHLGNIVGCVLPADVYARWCRQNGEKVLYICGADEYGTCTEVKAMEENLSPKQICDKYNEVHKAIYSWFNINFDYWGRTSTESPSTDLDWIHTKISQEIFRKVADNGYLLEQEMDQLFCVDLDMFVADRYVVGTCPKCGFENAKGDQCDKCCAVLNAIELIDPKYKFNKNSKLEVRKTIHLFLDLPKLEPQIRTWFDSVKNSWTANAISITEAWLRDGLKPRCVTRDLKWGTPVPNTKTYGDKYKNKIMYNWFDAPIGYLSITSQAGEDWEAWWKNPANIELTHFFGVDNTIFHSIIFPATLMATGDNYTLVDKINAVFYLNYKGGKFSKSEKIGVFGDGAIDTGIPADIWRFYLMYQRPERHDTEFNWKDLQVKINSELNDNLGNLVNRVTTFAYKRFGNIPECSKSTEQDDDFVHAINVCCEDYVSAMNNIEIRRGVTTVLQIGQLCNKYMNEMEPWKLIKTDTERCQTVFNVLLHAIALIGRFLKPIMPGTSQEIINMVGFEYTENVLTINKFTGTKLNQPKILFSKIDDAQIEALEKRFG